MKRFLYLLVSFFPSFLTAQEESGIHFVQNISWEEVRARANAENKYIFLDCYATWCAPCEAMDKNVYSNKQIGEYMNSKFISIKVQMDSSKYDSKEVKKWYADAQEIKNQYNIPAYPTYLFYSPDGNIVHEDMGAKTIDQFISLSNDALSPDTQYFTLLKNYKEGSKNYSVMPLLAKTSKKLKNYELANLIAQDYLQNYLYKSKTDQLYNSETLEFIADFLKSTKEKGFELFFNYPNKIDSLIVRGFSQNVVDNMITKEEISPELKEDDRTGAREPNWGKLASAICKKYNKTYSDRIILNAQIRWYQYKNNWPRLIDCQIHKVEKYGIDTSAFGPTFLNDMIYDVIFKHSDDTVQINKAIEWMEIILKRKPKDSYNIDTYANLLYKKGLLKEAIEWEEKAVLYNPDDPDIKATLLKMREKQPTW